MPRQFPLRLFRLTVIPISMLCQRFLAEQPEAFVTTGQMNRSGGAGPPNSCQLRPSYNPFLIDEMVFLGKTFQFNRSAAMEFLPRLNFYLSLTHYLGGWPSLSVAGSLKKIEGAPLFHRSGVPDARGFRATGWEAGFLLFPLRRKSLPRAQSRGGIEKH